MQQDVLIESMDGSVRFGSSSSSLLQGIGFDINGGILDWLSRLFRCCGHDVCMIMQTVVIAYQLPLTIGVSPWIGGARAELDGTFQRVCSGSCPGKY